MSELTITSHYISCVIEYFVKGKSNKLEIYFSSMI